RPDADPRGVGFFGISKGGGAGLYTAAFDPTIRCCVTDGAFAAFPTIVPYMRKWVAIYSNRRWLQVLLPSWYYEMVGRRVLAPVLRERGFRLMNLEHVIGRISPRPVLMIHGGGDTYIKPEMAEALFRRLREPREFWLVESAKHNQALHVAGDAYRQR